MAEILFGEIDDKFWTDEEAELESFFEKDVIGSGKDTAENGNSEIIINRPGRLEVEISESGERLPYLVKIVRRDEGWFWDCDCGCNYPCSHLAAVLLKVKREGIIKIFSREELKNEIPEYDQGTLFEKIDAEKRKIKKNEKERKELQLESGRQGFLSLENRDEKDEKKGRGDTGAQNIKLVFTIIRGSDGICRIAPALLNIKPGGKPGKIEEFFTEDRLSGSETEEENLLLDKIKASYSKEIPVIQEIYYFLDGRAFLYLESLKKIVRFEKSNGIKVVFRFAGLMKNNDVEFFPVFSPEKDGHPAEDEFSMDSIHIAGEKLFCLSPDNPVIFHTDCDPGTRFITAMMKQSSRRFSSSEINRYKSMAAERKPANISFDFKLEKAEIDRLCSGNRFKDVVRSERMQDRFLVPLRHSGDTPFIPAEKSLRRARG